MACHTALLALLTETDLLFCLCLLHRLGIGLGKRQIPRDEPVLCGKAGVTEPTSLAGKVLEATDIEGAQVIRDDVGGDVVSQALLEQEQPTDATPFPSLKG